MTTADRLAEEARGTFGRETIEELLRSSDETLAATATLPDFLPLLAERSATTSSAASSR